MEERKMDIDKLLKKLEEKAKDNGVPDHVKKYKPSPGWSAPINRRLRVWF